jgi:hypothetical protein
MLAAGCSLVEMPSNRSLAEPPNQSATTPVSSPAAKAGTGATGSILDAVHTAEEQSADASTMSATISLQVTGSTNASVSSSVKFQSDPLAMSESVHETVAGQNFRLDAIIGASGFYVKSTALDSDPSKPWIEIPAANLAQLKEIGVLLHRLQNDSPVSQSKLLLAVQDQQLSPAGHQVIDGVNTNAYAGSFNPATALPASEKKQFAAIIQQIQGNIDFELWLGPEDQLKKLTETEQLATADGQSTAKFSCTIHSLNQTVKISPPPASQVTTLPASTTGSSGDTT